MESHAGLCRRTSCYRFAHLLQIKIQKALLACPGVENQKAEPKMHISCPLFNISCYEFAGKDLLGFWLNLLGIHIIYGLHIEHTITQSWVITYISLLHGSFFSLMLSFPSSSEIHIKKRLQSFHLCWDYILTRAI